MRDALGAPVNIITILSSVIININNDNYHYQYNMGDAVGAPVNEETVGHLRQRLNVMRDIVKVGQDLLLNIKSHFQFNFRTMKRTGRRR